VTEISDQKMWLLLVIELMTKNYICNLVTEK